MFLRGIIQHKRFLGDNGEWVSGSQIDYSFDGLTSGEYIFEIIVNDSNENCISDSVNVTVMQNAITTKAAAYFEIWMSLISAVLLIILRKIKK